MFAILYVFELGKFLRAPRAMFFLKKNLSAPRAMLPP